MNAGSDLIASARGNGKTPALIGIGTTSVTYTDFADMILAFLESLDNAGIKPGDRIGMCTRPSPELFAGIIGCWAAGAVPVLPEPSRGLLTVLRTLGQARPRRIFIPWELSPLQLLAPALWMVPRHAAGHIPLRPPPTMPDILPELPALISYSSGTTGKATAIYRSTAVLTAQHTAVHTALTMQPGEVLYTTMPGFILAGLAIGQTCLIGETAHVTPEVLAKHGVTRLLGSPAFFRQLLAAPDMQPLPIRNINVGGALVPWHLLEALSIRFPEAQIVTVYGATEAEPIACQNFADVDQEEKNAYSKGLGLLAGRPVEELDCTIEPVDGLSEGGELIVAGPAVIAGPEGYHRTGDLVRNDDQGRLWLLGRLAAAWDGPAGLVAPLAVEGPAMAISGIVNAALVGRTGTLVIEGSEEAAQVAVTLLSRQSGLMGLKILRHEIPLEKRHHSKPDLAALQRIIERKQSDAVTLENP